MSIFRMNKAIERLEDDSQAVMRRICDLETTNRRLELEFTELYDKVRHQMSRMAKREAVARKENGEDLPAETPDDQFSHLDPVSRSIMMRRARGANPK